MLREYREPISYDYVFTGGKFAGKSVKEVLEIKADYIVFLQEKRGWDFYWQVLDDAESTPTQT